MQTNRSSGNIFLRLLVPQGGSFVTQVIVDINLLVFGLMVATGNGFFEFQTTDLLQWGGNLRAATMDGEWWRLMTCMFVHGGVMHLVSNMIALVFIGLITERAVGSYTFSILYLLTGICASAASMLWHANAVSVGASGAIFGIYGVMLALLVITVIPGGFSKIFLTIASVYIVYRLVVGAMTGIDTAAHIGGLVSGICLGLVFFKRNG